MRTSPITLSRTGPGATFLFLAAHPSLAQENAGQPQGAASTFSWFVLLAAIAIVAALFVVVSLLRRRPRGVSPNPPRT